MNVRTIMKQWLELNGYDGLCWYSCGCGLDDLMPCDGDVSKCIPAKKVIATEEHDESEWSDFNIGDEIFVPAESETGGKR